MDYKIIWSPDALEDIEAIGEFIARDMENVYSMKKNLTSLWRLTPNSESQFKLLLSIDSLSYSNLVDTFVGRNSAFSLCLANIKDYATMSH